MSDYGNIPPVTGGDMVPLEAVVQFVRLAHSYEQREVFDLLAERVVRAGKVCAVIFIEVFTST